MSRWFMIPSIPKDTTAMPPRTAHADLVIMHNALLTPYTVHHPKYADRLNAYRTLQHQVANARRQTVEA